MINKLILHIFLFLFSIQSQAVEYKAEGIIKFANVTESIFSAENILENQDQIIEGYLKNILTWDSFQLDIDIFLDSEVYISSSNDKGRLGTNFSISYYGENTLISIGEFDSVASKSFYNRLFSLKDPSLGSSLLLTKKVVIGENYTLNSTYIENNKNFNVLLIRSFLNETLYLGASFIPNIQNNSYELFKKENKAAIDNTIIYYNEYMGIGYGADFAIRHYFSNAQEERNIKRDIAFGGSLDYFGFSFKSRYLIGNNNYNLNNQFSSSYRSFENSLYYNIYKFLVGVYFIGSKIETVDSVYETSLLEIDLQYSMSNNLTLYGGLLHEITNNTNNQGFLVGISLIL